MKKVPMTIDGAKKLHHELERLEGEERRKIVTAIAEARAHGDLKENAEYHAAKELQGHIEARIRDLKDKISHAQIIDVTKMKNEGNVIFGATITLLNLDTEEKVTYQIVGEDEANLKEKKISVNSPIARAMIGKRVSDEVEVKTPGGLTSFEILEVEYV